MSHQINNINQDTKFLKMDPKKKFGVAKYNNGNAKVYKKGSTADLSRRNNEWLEEMSEII